MGNKTYITEVGGNPVFLEDTASFVGNVGDNTILKGQTASDFYMSADGTISTTSEDGKKIQWDLSNNIITDDKGDSTTFGNFLDSLGSTVGSFLDIVNKTAQTYENTTGSKIISTGKTSTGQLTSSDLNTLSAVVNSSINQLKKNALYIGFGVGAIVLTTILLKKKNKKTKRA